VTIGTASVGSAAGGIGQVAWTGGSLNITHLQLDGPSAFTLGAGSGRVLKLATLSASGASKLDLTDNRLIVTSGSAGTWDGANYDGVTGLIRAGRHGGAWDGAGIVTGMTVATGATALTTLAVASAQQARRSTFGGQPVDPTDVLVMYTYAGDADLKGETRRRRLLPHRFGVRVGRVGLVQRRLRLQRTRQP
jgi:hypothetical protein